MIRRFCVCMIRRKKIQAFLLKTVLYKEGCLLDFFVFRKFAEFSTVVKKNLLNSKNRQK